MEASREVYREWVPAGIEVKIIISFVILMIAVTSLLVALITPFESIILLIVTGITVTTLTLIYYNFRGLEIIITENFIEVRYGVFNRKRITLESIKEWNETKTNFSRYFGIGIRIGRDGSWAYTTSFGQGVEIIKDKGRPFVFSTNNPNKICTIIKELINKNHRN
ncbi:MAG: hypothetical protein ACTSYQ_00190 [Candidatus Odinarchaeia archaeon]